MLDQIIAVLLSEVLKDCLSDNESIIVKDRMMAKGSFARIRRRLAIRRACKISGVDLRSLTDEERDEIQEFITEGLTPDETQGFLNGQ